MPPPLPPDDPHWDALTRYVAGELPDDEAEELRQWISADAGREELVAGLRRIWAESRGLRQTWDAQTALRRIKQAPAGPARVIRLPKFYREETLSPWQRGSRIGIRAAAVLALALGGTGLWWQVSRTPAGSGEPLPTAEVTTPRGQRASLNLPDGTHVLLGPASTIRYAVARDRGPRTIQLEGGAYFVVTHDSTRPFTVHTAYGTATDLGTRFDVRAYAADSVLAVAVAEGKVGLEDGTTLSQGHLGRMDATGRVSVRTDVDLDRYLAWTEGRLEFRDVPLREAIRELGRWYDLDMRLADSRLGQRRLTASFQEEAAPEMLRLIASSLELRVNQQGRMVTLEALR